MHAAIDYIAHLGEVFGGLPADADLRACLAAGFDLMKAHDDMLARRLIDGLRASNTVRIFGITDPSAFSRRVSTVTFTVDGKHPNEIAKFFAERGIQVWSGHNYGLEANRRLGILESGGGVGWGQFTITLPARSTA